MATAHFFGGPFPSEQSLSDASAAAAAAAKGLPAPPEPPANPVVEKGITKGEATGNAAFQDVLVDELVPFIDANFRTIANRDNRAMAGLSMGGGETRFITLAKPDVFGYWGLMSGGFYTPADLQGKTKPKYIFMSYGSKETGERGAPAIPKAEADLKTAGYNVHTFISDGTAHEFQTWRRSLLQMAPKLFK